MERKSRRITSVYSGVAAVTAFVTQPIPGGDELVVVPVQYALCARLARERGVSIFALPWRSIQKIIWYGAAARLVANFSLIVVPVLGAFANSITAVALTEFLARWLDDYMNDPAHPPPEVTMAGLKTLFVDAFKKVVPGQARAAQGDGDRSGAGKASSVEARLEAPRADDGGVRGRDRELSRLRDAARQMGVDKLKDGTWFRRIAGAHVKKHCATITRDHWDQKYPELDVEARAARQIRSVARRASATGALASVGTSTGELLSFFTEGLAAPIGIPAALTSMALEAGYTALLQIDLVCDLASIYGVPFDPDDVGEVTTLFGLALGIDVKKPRPGDEHAADGAPQGLTAKLIELEDGDIGTRIGRKMLEDAVIKNIFPVVGLGIAARWNYVGTTRLAAAARKYVRYRGALVHALARLDLSHVTEPALLVEGAWLLATVDGEAGHEEIMAVSRIVDSLPEAARTTLALDRTLGDDEEPWFQALARVPAAMHDSLLDVLYLVAATDRELQPAERRFLRRVGKALGCTIDFPRIEQLCAHLASGEELPGGFRHAIGTPP